MAVMNPYVRTSLHPKSLMNLSFEITHMYSSHEIIFVFNSFLYIGTLVYCPALPLVSKKKIYAYIMT